MDWLEQRGDPQGTTVPPRFGAAFIGIVVGGAVAVALALTGRHEAAIILVVLLVTLTSARKLSPAVDVSVQRVLHAVGVGAGKVLSWLLLGGLALLVIVPVWVISRVTRWDMLRPRRTDHGRWQHRHLRSWQILPQRPFSREEGDSGLRRVHAAAAVALPIVVVLLAIGPGRDRLGQLIDEVTPRGNGSGAASPDDATAATDGEWFVTGDGPQRPGDPLITENGPWAQEVLDTRVEIKEYDPNLILRVRDVETEYFNYENRTRRSWQPPTSREPLDVWFFGSSQLYGPWLIRDDHTIASEFAKLAWADDIPVRASNFGISGYENWQQTMLMAQMLSERPPPDLVIFYGGYNDLHNYIHPGAPTQVSSVYAKDVARALEIANADVSAPDEASIERIDTWSPENAATIYDRGIRLAEDILEARSIPFLNFLQPSLWSRDRPEDDATLEAIGADREFHETFGEVYDAARQAIRTDVIDLSESLDNLAGVVYWDEVHHTEAGNAAVASAAYSHVLPELQRLQERDGSGR